MTGLEAVLDATVRRGLELSEPATASSSAVTPAVELATAHVRAGDDEPSFAALRAGTHEVRQRVVPAALLAHVASPATSAPVARGRAGGPENVRSSHGVDRSGAAEVAVPVGAGARTGGR